MTGNVFVVVVRNALALAATVRWDSNALLSVKESDTHFSAIIAHSHCFCCGTHTSIRQLSVADVFLQMQLSLQMMTDLCIWNVLSDYE